MPATGSSTTLRVPVKPNQPGPIRIGGAGSGRDSGDGRTVPAGFEDGRRNRRSDRFGRRVATLTGRESGRWTGGADRPEGGADAPALPARLLEGAEREAAIEWPDACHPMMRPRAARRPIHTTNTDPPIFMSE